MDKRRGIERRIEVIEESLEKSLCELCGLKQVVMSDKNNYSNHITIQKDISYVIRNLERSQEYIGYLKKGLSKRVENQEEEEA